MSWSGYQDRQLKTLESLEKSFNSSLGISSQIKQSLTSISSAMNSIADTIIGRFGTEAEKSARAINKAASEFSSSVDKNKAKLDQFGDVIKNVTDDYKKSMEEIAEQDKKDQKRKEQEESFWFYQFGNKLLGFLDRVGKVADNYSDISNNMMRITGMSGDQSRGLRTAITQDIVAQLNMQTGHYYNPLEAYKQMTAIANQTGIGNKEELTALTRPMLLAYESLDLNWSSLATLLGRWYNRYNFSSIAMEGMVDEIRGSTANNNATGQATLENLAALERWIARTTGGNQEAMLDMSRGVSNATAWLESMGILTDKYTAYVADIASGDANYNSTVRHILGGSSMTVGDAQALLKSGGTGVEKVYQALVQGEANIVGGLIKSGAGDLLGPALAPFSIDINQALDTYNTLNSPNMKSLEEFKAGIKDTQSATELVGDKYVSGTDKILNYLSTMTTYLADVQESLGFGLSDVVKSIGIYLGIKSFTGGIGGGFNIGGALGGIKGVLGGSSSGGILGALAPVGKLLGIGSLIVGALGGITAVITDKKAKDKEGADNAAQIISQSSGTTLSGLEEVTTWDNETGSLVTSYKRSATDSTSYNLTDQLALISNAAKKEKSGYWDFNIFTGEGANLSNSLQGIPIIGTIASLVEASGKSYNSTVSAAKESALVSYLADLSPEELEVYRAYEAYGTFRNRENMDVAMRFMQNFKNIYNMYKSDPSQVVWFNSSGDMQSPVDRKSYWGYETGSNYITRNQLAYIHEGEAIVPKKYNPQANITELEILREQAKNNAAKVDGDTAKYVQYLEDTASTLGEIREFLTDWKSSNDRTSTVNAAKARFDMAAAGVANYLTGGA